MNDFFPYIHQIKKKKQDEPEQLRIELEPPPQKQEKFEEEPYMIVIELF